MYTALNTAAIGVHPRDLGEAIEYARIGGFAGLEIDALAVADLVQQRGMGEVRKLFDVAQIRAAGWNLPVNWRGSEQDWRTDLALLPSAAAAAAALGATRCSTWIPPASDDRQDDLDALRVEQVVYVHINDAPAGIDRDQQMDLVRALPGETGVIDITGFLHALQRIGYDGPVVPEPFKKELADLPADVDRLRAVGESVRAVFARAALV